MGDGANGSGQRPRWKRVVLKLSGEAFADRKIGYGIDGQMVARIAAEVTEVRRDLSTETPAFPAKTYRASAPDVSLRAFLPDVQQASAQKKAQLVDVRSPAEFTGEILAPPGLPETCQRGGHIPGAKSIPWGKNCNDDGTFKSEAELKKLYADQGIQGDGPVIAYCRIGERSSLTWFVLKHLLGFQNVKNYDGSWTEWGNLVGAPVEKP